MERQVPPLRARNLPQHGSLKTELLCGFGEVASPLWAFLSFYGRAGRKTGTPEGSFQFRPKWNLDCEIAFLCGDCMAFILKSIHPSAALLPLDKSLRIRPYPSLPQLEGGPQILERGRAVPFLSKLTASPVYALRVGTCAPCSPTPPAILGLLPAPGFPSRRGEPWELAE